MFSNNNPILKNALKLLKQNMDPNNTLENLVCSGIQKILQNPSVLDNTTLQKCPFTEHFFSTLKTIPQDDDGHWIALFEDLAIFFKIQSSKTEHPLPLEGIKIMNYFETCGEWLPTDTSIISQHYYLL